MSHSFSRQISLFLRCAAVALSLLLAALCVAQQKSDTPKNAAKKFKNVKILKNLSKDDLLVVMRKFNNDLGVTCEYCHVMEKFRSFEDCYKDDKQPKQQARKMLLMTRDLNKRYAAVQNKVSCWTCHAGKEQPVNAPPL